MIRQGWQMGFVFLTLMISGCAKKDGWNSFPVKIYSDSTITSSSDKSADFQAAMSFWEEKAGHKLFDYQGEWNNGEPYSGSATSVSGINANVIFFQNPWPFASNIAGQTTLLSTGKKFTGAVIMINPDTDFCASDCSGETNLVSQRKAFAHELGHFLGLSHIQDITNIMYPVVQPGGSLDDVTIDTTAFAGLVTQ